MATVAGDHIRVLIVDDHEMFATSLARSLDDEPDIAVVSVCRTVDDAKATVAGGLELDVVLADFRLGDGDGVALTAWLRERRPAVKVVMLTASDDDVVLAAALEAGCTGFVTKLEPLDRVVHAVRSAVAGEAVITPGLLAQLLPRLSGRQRGPNPDLTGREREVLALVARGLTNQQIADELVLSRDTIRNHVASILSKLGVHSKLQAVAVGVRRGLVRLPDV